MADDPRAPQFVLLAAGRSSRYGRPKQVDPLGPTGGSILTYTIVDAVRAGFSEIVIVTSRELKDTLDAHIRDTLGRRIAVTYAIQRLESLPRGLEHMAASRTRPWGTGQAILAAGPLIRGPFAVANADDWYGPEALEALARELSAPDSGAASPPPASSDGGSGAVEEEAGPRTDQRCTAVALAYPMEATLSANGGVSRGWIQADDGRRIRRVLEMKQVRASSGGGMVGMGPDGHPRPIPAGTPASMNLWGFHPCILPLLEDGFRDFLYDEAGDGSAEYLLSSALDQFVEAGDLDLRVVPAGRRWFGVTHPGDAEVVRRRLSDLHRGGVYASPLASSLD
jgi:hypothetical protein